MLKSRRLLPFTHKQAPTHSNKKSKITNQKHQTPSTIQSVSTTDNRPGCLQDHQREHDATNPVVDDNENEEEHKHAQEQEQDHHDEEHEHTQEYVLFFWMDIDNITHRTCRRTGKNTSKEGDVE